MREYGLGRLHAPDPRDRAFLLSVPEITRTNRYWWGYGQCLNQLRTKMCVAFAWSHFIIDAPITHRYPLLAAESLYHEAQLLDEWPGEDYDGTSVRAGAKALLNHTLVQAEYRWAFDLGTLVANVLEVGPVIVGVNWYEQMFEPDAQNYVRIGGDVAGGHAFKIDGVNVTKRFLRLKNSWGESWGRGGFARITFDDMARLLGEDGEACMAQEVPGA